MMYPAQMAGFSDAFSTAIAGAGPVPDSDLFKRERLGVALVLLFAPGGHHPVPVRREGVGRRRIVFAVERQQRNGFFGVGPETFAVELPERRVGFEPIQLAHRVLGIRIEPGRPGGEVVHPGRDAVRRRTPLRSGSFK